MNNSHKQLDGVAEVFNESVKKEKLNALHYRLICPDCSQDLSREIHPRTFIQDPHVLICQTQSCKQFGKRWSAPTVSLKPAPSS